MQLVIIQGAMLATPGTAEAWRAVLEETPRAYITTPAGAYRSAEIVEDMYDSTPARRKSIYGVPLGVGVARPKSRGGGGSVHENGRCLDVNAFNAAVMRKHGFVNTIAKEPWHWEYRGAEGGSGSGGSATADIYEEDVMTTVIGHKDQEIAVLNPLLEKGRRIVKLTETDLVAGYARLYSPTRNGLIPMYERDVYLGMLASAEDEATRVQANLRVVLPSGSGGGGSDLSPVLQAIAAGEAQDARDVQTLLAAIGAVDEATLATFGLKRS